MKILIADSGSTKTDWVVVENGQIVRSMTTPGINPILQIESEVVHILEACNFAAFALHEVEEAYFYGAGCATDREFAIIARILQHFGLAGSAEVASDILGAARSLFGCHSGIASILGTGCNSGIYNGKGFSHNIPPLGYILGDEGSGSYLGKLFLGNLYKGLFDTEIEKRFDECYPRLTRSEVMNHIYRQPFPNRYMASFAPFIYQNMDCPEMSMMVNNAIRLFFERNILLYQTPRIEVGFIGSIAYFFQEIIRQQGHSLGLTIGKIERSPIDGLVEFHSQTKEPA